MDDKRLNKREDEGREDERLEGGKMRGWRAES
jgi:hypothetical protein